MHVMLKRAAASAIPALVGLAISPATAMAAMAAPHTSQAAAGPAKGGRQTHERLMRLRLSDTHRGRLAATARTAIPVYSGPDIARFAHFYRDPGTVKGGPAIGVIAYGNYDKIIGCHINASGGSGIDSSSGGTTGSSSGGTTGNGVAGTAAVPPQ
ncbi:MAG TPA: hypothetical protein VE733_12810 [Streptosporangiaceae bacterium]|nr:hypothetical protein [Streptosporangiaceae bacterium]